MSSSALFNLLPDFGVGAPRVTAAAAEQQRAHSPRQPVPQQPVNVDALVARAVADAETALAARLEETHQAELAAERQAGAEAMSANLQQLGAEAGKAIAERLDAMETGIGALVGSSVARILARVMGEDLRQRSLQALADTIRTSIGDSDAVRIRVRGPQSLFAALEAELADKAARFEFTDAPGFDLTVFIDEAVFETRMAEWAETVAEALP